jgi:8-oxo-dGTP pyrophosphatase MutT (NUDIX family)
VRDAFDIESLRARLKPEISLAESGKAIPDAAVAVILDSRCNGGSLLLIKRTERKGDPWSGQIAFPGGRRSAKDQTYLETATREASEEVGISLREHEVLGVLPSLYSRTKRVLVAPYVFQLRSSVTIRLNEEVAASFWVPLYDLSQMKTTKRQVRDLERTLTAPSYVYEDYVIWGLTYRIINLLLNRNPPDL